MTPTEMWIDLDQDPTIQKDELDIIRKSHETSMKLWVTKIKERIKLFNFEITP